MVQAKDLIKTDFVKVDLNDTVAKFLGKIRQKNQTFAVVYDKKKYLGLVDRRFLLTSRIQPAKMRMKNLTKKVSKKKTPFFVPKLKTNSTIEEICKLFSTTGARALPVFEKDKLKGVITARSVMREIRKYYRGLPVTELASIKNLIIAKEREKAATTIRKMFLKKIDRVPVVGEDDKIAGIVTACDVMKRFHRMPVKAKKMPSQTDHDDWGDPSWDTGEKNDMLKLPIRNIMTPYPMVHCLNIKSTVNQALDLMIKEDVNSVVIVEDEKPVGIITLQDIMWDYSLE